MSNASELPDLPAGIQDDESHRLANQLNSVAIRLLRSVSQADDVMGLTAPQASLLSVLVFAGPQTVGELARRERVSSPAITKHVDNLEEKGLLKRSRREADRRVVDVSATDAGVALLHKGRAERIQALAEKIEQLDAAEREMVERSLELIYGVL